MRRKLGRAVSPVLLAMTGLCAFAASGAGAAEFHSEVAPTALTGEADGLQLFTFTDSGAGLSCKKVALEGTVVPKTAIEFELGATFSECTSSGLPAAVKMNGCRFNITTAKVGEHYPVHIVCPVGVKAEISGTALPCTYRIGSQTPGKGVGLTSQGTGSTRDLTVGFTLAGIAYELAGSGSCKGMGVDLDFGGAATLRGFQDEKGVHGAQVGIWIE